MIAPITEFLKKQLFRPVLLQVEEGFANREAVAPGRIELLQVQECDARMLNSRLIAWPQKKITCVSYIPNVCDPAAASEIKKALQRRILLPAIVTMWIFGCVTHLYRFSLFSEEKYNIK